TPEDAARAVLAAPELRTREKVTTWRYNPKSGKAKEETEKKPEREPVERSSPARRLPAGRSSGGGSAMGLVMLVLLVVFLLVFVIRNRSQLVALGIARGVPPAGL